MNAKIVEFLYIHIKGVLLFFLFIPRSLLAAVADLLVAADI